MSKQKKPYPVWEGYGKELHTALENAWELAKEDGAKPGKYVVHSIVIETVNPIHGYIVVIGPGG
jgi:hypothetical protein